MQTNLHPALAQHCDLCVRRKELQKSFKEGLLVAAQNTPPAFGLQKKLRDTPDWRMYDNPTNCKGC